MFVTFGVHLNRYCLPDKYLNDEFYSDYSVLLLLEDHWYLNLVVCSFRNMPNCRCQAEADSSHLPCWCTSLPLCLQVAWFVKGCLSSAPRSAKSNSCGIGLGSSTIHLRLTHPTTTAAVRQSPLQVLLCFIARNQFPVGNRMLAKYSIWSPFAACESRGVGEVWELITGSPLLRLTWS